MKCQTSVIIIGTIAYRGLESLSTTGYWVTHTHKVISKAHLIEKTLVDKETGLRGFMIAGKKEFLEPYEAGIKVYRETFDDLRKQISDNPLQQAKLDKINLLVEKWRKVQALPAIALRRQVVKGQVNAAYLQEELSEGTGKGIFDEMRKIMDAMSVKFRIDGNIKGEALTEGVAKSMVDQETGQRGFLITGKEEFLEPYIAGQKKLKENLSKLRSLISRAHDRIGTINDLNALKKLAIAWQKESIIIEGKVRKVGDNTKLDKEIQESLEKNKETLLEMREITDRMAQMFELAENGKAVALVVKIAKSMVDQETVIRGFVITKKESFLESAALAKVSFQVETKALQKLNSQAYDIPQMKSSIAKLDELAAYWLKKSASPEILARRKMNKSKVAMKDIQAFIERGTGKALMDTMRQELSEFVNVEKALLAKREIESDEQVTINELLIIFGTLFAIVTGVFLMLYISKKLIGQVGGEPSEILEITKNLASGNIDSALMASHSKGTTTGIYASVKEILKVFKDKSDLALEQDWLKSGQNKLNDEVSGELDLMSITDKAIHFVAEYLKAPVGAIYIVDKNGTHLNLMGTYAFTRRKNQNDKIDFSQGLVGEAAVSQKLICLSSIPEDYTAISSATGAISPKSLLVVPLMHEGKVKGVLEIGTLEELKDIELEFMEAVGLIVGSAVNSADIRQQVEYALDKSQILAEELQSQQEELKVSNEELTEQTEALKESEERLMVQSEELRVSNEELTKKTEALNLQKKAVEDKNKDIEIASKELEVKAKDLEIASKYKSEFLANMSHELRTPLNSLLILSESLASNDEGNLSDDQLESVNVINAGGKDLLGLINDILDLSKVEAGKLDVHLDRTEIAKMVESMKRQFQHVADKKKLAFVIEADPELSHTYADKKRVEQILKNLLSNAFKFTSSGSVTLKVSRPEQDLKFHGTKLNHENSVALTVIDSGIGIPPEKQKTIFEAFQQADGSTSRKYGGTGLGLTISRELSRLMHGEIHIKSEAGVGSEFTLYLQLSETQELSSSSVQTEEMPRASVKEFLDAGEVEPVVKGSSEKLILIIEDDEVFSKVLKKVVEAKGYEALCIDTGMQGLTLAKLHNPSAILLDLGLPDIDGKQVLEQLKFNLKTRHIPVHVISGRDSEEDLLSLGAIGHLTKPVAKSEIEGIRSKIEGFTGSEGKKILLVDDDENTIYSIQKLIARDNLTILSSSTALEAEEKILKEKPDCVILDLSLPDMSGFELLKKMTKDAIELPPVIIYTGKELSRVEYNELNEMAKSIVIKGAESSARLLDDVSLFLHSVEKRMPEEQQKIIEMLHDSSEMLKGKKVLVVDDDSRNLFAVGKILQKNGMKVTTAENGQIAVDKVKKEDFDAVLMDIMMPVMDGYEATQELRKLKGENLPIIAFTAKAMPEDREKCINAGANDYITKPLDSQKLLSLLSVWLFQ
jgi:CheY-like chemotaxis protein